MMWMILQWMHAALTRDEARAWPQKQKLPSNQLGRIEHTPLHCSHLLIRPPSTWTIPSTAPIGVAPPKGGCRFA